jgi:hypothetical protein
LAAEAIKETMTPSQEDVLSGRGPSNARHNATTLWWSLIQQEAMNYRHLSRRQDKSYIVKSIHQKVQDVGGRFLERLGNSGKSNRVQWQELSTREAYFKTSQALRDINLEKWSCSRNENFQVMPSKQNQIDVNGATVCTKPPKKNEEISHDEPNGLKFCFEAQAKTSESNYNSFDWQCLNDSNPFTIFPGLSRCDSGFRYSSIAKLDEIDNISIHGEPLIDKYSKASSKFEVLGIQAKHRIRERSSSIYNSEQNLSSSISLNSALHAQASKSGNTHRSRPSIDDIASPRISKCKNLNNETIKPIIGNRKELQSESYRDELSINEANLDETGCSMLDSMAIDLSSQQKQYFPSHQDEISCSEFCDELNRTINATDQEDFQDEDLHTTISLKDTLSPSHTMMNDTAYFSQDTHNAEAESTAKIPWDKSILEKSFASSEYRNEFQPSRAKQELKKALTPLPSSMISRMHEKIYSIEKKVGQISEKFQYVINEAVALEHEHMRLMTISSQEYCNLVFDQKLPSSSSDKNEIVQNPSSSGQIFDKEQGSCCYYAI